MFDNNLRYCREELELTQEQLGKFFELSDASIRAWENATSSIPLSKLAKFCSEYNYSLDFVCGLTRKNTHYGPFKINRALISKNLKKFRKSRNISQQVLSDECKLPQTTYSGYETGKYLITTTNLYYLCKTYNISMDYIVNRTNNMFCK